MWLPQRPIESVLFVNRMKESLLSVLASHEGVLAREDVGELLRAAPGG
jgi:hypothetical protein